MKEFIGARLQAFSAPGSMGAVKDTKYTRCFWPKLDEPAELFAVGSAGLVIEGPPTPRNVIFPSDTVFAPNTRSDCHFFRERDATGQEFIAELTAVDAKTISALKGGNGQKATMKAAAWFVRAEDSPLDPLAKSYRKIGQLLVETVKP